MNRILLGFILVSFIGCSTFDPLAGGSSQQGNGVVVGKVVNKYGTAAPNIVVKLYPLDYNPLRSAAIPGFCIDTTDSCGNYLLKAPLSSLVCQIYASNILKTVNALAPIITISGDTTHVADVVVSVPGTVKVAVPDNADSSNGYIYIPGTDIFVALNGNTEFAVLTSVPEGVLSSIQYSVVGSIVSSVMRYDVSVIAADTVTVFNPAWKYARSIILNTTASGAAVAGNVYDFPVLIRLNSSNFNCTQAENGGADIRFTKRDNTFLSYEIERWDAVNGQAEIWVRVDTVHGNDGAQSLMMYWGNPNAADSSNGAAVFDTAAGFAGVWHLGQPAGAIVPDATANGINGTATATATVSGAIGAAQSFNGTSSLIQTSASASDKVNFPDTGTYTVSAWVKTDVLDTFCQAIVFKSNAQYGMQIIPEKEWEFVTYIDKTRWEGSRSPASAGSWHALTGVRNGTKQYLYVDGVCVDSSITNAIALPPENVARVYDKPLEIGHCPDGGRNPDRFFNGIIDEVRISSIAINADWMKLSYMNQKEQDALVKW
jgi:hypothetical protein